MVDHPGDERAAPGGTAEFSQRRDEALGRWAWRTRCGESFLVARDGLPVGELTPVRSRQFVAAGVALAAFAGAPLLASDRLRTDLHAVIDQDTTPRA